MSIKVMTWVWEHGPEDAGERLALLALSDFADDSGTCWPSMARVAQKSCVEERSARRIVRRLEQKGWLTTCVGGGRRQCNEYRILMVIPDPKSRTESPPDRKSPGPKRPKPGPPGPKTRTPGSAEPSRTIIEPSVEKTRDFAREFDAVWHHYPRRVGKGAAEKAWAKARKAETYETIASALGQFIRSVGGTDPQFVPHFATWLNQKRWLDDPGHGSNRQMSSAENLQRLSRIDGDDLETSAANLHRLFAPSDDQPQRKALP